MLVCPCTIKESDISSRPKTSLPVVGNLAIEIFFGPNLAGGLRIRRQGSAGGVFWKLLRVILRRASRAPVCSSVPMADLGIRWSEFR